MTKTTFITIMLVAMFFLPSSATAQREGRELTTEEAELALAVARVCANERSLAGATREDCAMIWQAARRHGDTATERLTWLRRHSSCVLGDRSLTEIEERGNCRWTRGLSADTAAQPDGWPSHWSWENHSERWASMLSFCENLVRGRTPAGGWPCPEDPDTWGSRTLDHARAISRGMTPVMCAGTLNEGYLFESREARRARRAAVE